MLLRSSLALPFVLVSTIAALPLEEPSQKQLKTRSSQTLRFTSEGTFQISIFEDLHYGEAEETVWGPEQDIYSEKVINTVLDNESPQLVILNGDLITGENTFLSNSSTYVDEIVRPLVQRNLTWASTYGNHDSDFNLSRTAIFSREKAYSNSLTENMVNSTDAGVSNYYLEVFSNDESKVSPEVILWFFDSRDSEGAEIAQPNWVDQSVVDWFIETNSKLQETAEQGFVIPSLAFVHIPVNAMVAFQSTMTSANEKTEPGINDDDPLAQQGYAEGQGAVSGDVFDYGGQDIPFMEALLEVKGLMAIFSGHDHGDDWCFKWDSKLPGMNLTGNGIDLCFGRHSGYGGYGSWTRGSRQILLDLTTLGNSTETWIRLEDETISGKVTLNSTYGSDIYPVVANTDTGLP